MQVSKKSSNLKNSESSNPFGEHYIVQLPENLDLDKLLQENLIEVKFNKENPIKIRDRLAYILGSLTNTIRKNEFQVESNLNLKFGILNAEILQKVIRDYKCYLTYSIDNQIITKGPKYKKGINSNKFAYSSKYGDAKMKDYYIYDPALLKSIYKRRRDKQSIERYF